MAAAENETRQIEPITAVSVRRRCELSASALFASNSPTPSNSDKCWTGAARTVKRRSRRCVKASTRCNTPFPSNAKPRPESGVSCRGDRPAGEERTPLRGPPRNHPAAERIAGGEVLCTRFPNIARRIALRTRNIGHEDFSIPDFVAAGVGLSPRHVRQSHLGGHGGADAAQPASQGRHAVSPRVPRSLAHRPAVTAPRRSGRRTERRTSMSTQTMKHSVSTPPSRTCWSACSTRAS